MIRHSVNPNLVDRPESNVAPVWKIFKKRQFLSR
jgi:hypothetical protein